MIILYVIVCVLLLVYICLSLYTRYRRLGRLIYDIPGPKTLPFLGNTLSFNTSSDKIWTLLHDLSMKFPIYRLLSGFTALSVTRDPDYCKILLSCRKNISKHIPGYSNIRFCGNNGLVVSGGKLWETRRKLLNQAFSPYILEIYYRKIDSQSKRLIANLMTYERTNVHDVSQMFMKFSFDAACQATMDYDVDSAMEEKGKAFREALIEIGEICYYRTARPYIQDWMMKFLPIGRHQAKLWKKMEDFAIEVIDERRKFHAKTNVLKEYLANIENANLEDVKVPKKNLTVLDVLLLNEERGLIDSKGVLDETILMIGAGFETTAVALTFFCIALAEHKEIQDLVRQEIEDVMGGFGNQITPEDIKKLDYLERCAKESMRLYTVTPFLGRSINHDLDIGDYRVPEGSEMYVNVFQLHRDPKLWPDPLKYDPDRFLPENLVGQHSFAYIPFSRGPRNCIGQKFAMNEVKSLMAHIIYNFRLEPVDRSADFKFDLGVTLQLPTARVKFTRIE